MIPWAQWQKALWVWATQVSGGRTVIWAKQEQNVAEPRRPYITLDVMTVRKVGDDGIHYTFDNDQDEGEKLLEQRYGTRRMRLNVQVFANANGQLDESAMAIAGSLVDSFDSPSLRDILTQAGLGFSSVGDIQDLAQIEQSQFGGRASFDAVFEGAAFTPLDQAPKGQLIDRVVAVTVDLEGNPAPELTFDVTG